MFEKIRIFTDTARALTGKVEALTVSIKGGRYGDTCRASGDILYVIAPVADLFSPGTLKVGTAVPTLQGELVLLQAQGDPSFALAVSGLSTATENLMAAATEAGLADIVAIGTLILEAIKLFREFRKK